MSSEAFLDSRFAALPQLLRDATNPERKPADVCRFKDALVQTDVSLFAGALHFMSREGNSFVLLHDNGGAFLEPRGWARWPLRRLFAAHRCSLITNPISRQRALAVPFEFHRERHVVVAPLGTEPDTAQTVFLDVLQSIVLPTARENRSDRTPRFVWFGSDRDIGERLQRLTEQRRWPLYSAPTFGHLMLMLEQDAADIALIHGAALREPLNKLRTIRHAAKIGNAPIVYFTGEKIDEELAVLTDYQVGAGATDAQLLKILKSAARALGVTRTKALAAIVRRMEPELQACTTIADLAQTCARCAVILGFDRICVLLHDENGIVHSAHVPDDGVLTDEWPTPFISGERIAYARASERFFEEAFDDRQYARRVSVLAPLSAAAMPIADGVDILGTLTAFSLQQQAFDPEFGALANLCEQTGRACARLRRTADEPKNASQLRIGECTVDVYNGPTSSTPISVACDGNRAAIVAIDDENEKRATRLARDLLEKRTDLHSAALDYANGGVLLALFEDGALSYACAGMPLPLRVPSAGPVPALSYAGRLQRGTIESQPDSTILFVSNELALRVETAEIVRAVQHELRRGRESVASAVSELPRNRKKVSFAAITRRSNAVRAPRQPASV
jgi:hypothetical protein